MEERWKAKLVDLDEYQTLKKPERCASRARLNRSDLTCSVMK